MTKDTRKPADRRSPAGRSADARGETGTDADAVGRRSPPDTGADVGGMAGTTDAGLADRSAASPSPRTAPVDRDAVRQDSGTRSSAPDRPGGARAAATPDAEADDEGPLESLGKAISSPVLGSPPEERGEPGSEARPQDRKGK